MRISRLVFFALLVLAALIPTAASSSTAQTSVLKTRGYIVVLSADGSRVAALTNKIKGSCDRIVVWTPAKKSIARIGTGIGCPNFDGSVNTLKGIALAGKRVAWIEGVGGNDLDMNVRSRTLTAKKTLTVDSYAENGYGAGETPDGDWIGNIAGHGNLLGYNRWHICTALPATVTNPDDYGPHCDQPAAGDSQDYVVSEQELVKVVGRSSIEIASAPDTHSGEFAAGANPIVAVDANRFATQAPNGQVTLYSPAGDILQHVAIPSGTFAGTALQGSQLVTLRNGNLELYNVNSGLLVKTIPLAAGSVLRDLQSGLAVYLVGRKVHVLRLSDGAGLTISPPGTGSVDAQIESPGLYYSYNYKNVADHGRIAFLPFATVLKKLG